jgi:hypothetical protein
MKNKSLTGLSAHHAGYAPDFQGQATAVIELLAETAQGQFGDTSSGRVW